MKKDLLKEELIGKLFNEKTCQVAYEKHQFGYMEPGDHGYVKGMKVYHDLENDMCICRHFDNPLVSLKEKYGFKYIEPDIYQPLGVGNARYLSFDPERSIKISDVKRILSVAQRPDKLAKLAGKIYIKETKGKKPKIIVSLDKETEKKERLMRQALLISNRINTETNKEHLVDLIFELDTILKKNLFTKEELKNFIK